MINFKKAAVLPAVAALALAGLVSTDISASAQSAYTNGSDYVRPSRHYVRRRVAERPLTVRRVAPPPPMVEMAPPYNPSMGPGAIVTGPVGIASTVVSLPFRILGGIFPSYGSPLAVIGAPIQIAGRIAQAPFQIVEAPFGGPGPFGGPSYY